MKIIGYVSGFGITSTFPNAICGKIILDELRKDKDIKIDVICDGVVERIPEKDWKRNPIYMFQRISLWPSINPDVAKACRNEIIMYLNKNKCDCLIIPHKPYEIVWAACEAKKQFKDVKLFLYELDPIANLIDANNGIGKHLFALSEKAEIKAYKAFDHIFHMRCNHEKFSHPKYDKYIYKSSYMDFPLVIPKKREHTDAVSYKGETVNLVFTGLVNDVYRSPEYLLNVIDGLRKKIPVKIDFYSKGNSVERIENMSKKVPEIQSHGYVSPEEVLKVMEKADFLVNIGNKYSSMLPSKLLNYISMGKPIIHIQNQEHDACIPYLERYGSYIVLNENNSIEDSINETLDFIKKSYKHRLSSSEVEERFVENTPAWNAEQIKKLLNDAMLSEQK